MKSKSAEHVRSGLKQDRNYMVGYEKDERSAWKRGRLA